MPSYDSANRQADQVIKELRKKRQQPASPLVLTDEERAYAENLYAQLGATDRQDLYRKCSDEQLDELERITLRAMKRSGIDAQL